MKIVSFFSRALSCDQKPLWYSILDTLGSDKHVNISFSLGKITSVLKGRHIQMWHEARPVGRNFSWMGQQQDEVHDITPPCSFCLWAGLTGQLPGSRNGRQASLQGGSLPHCFSCLSAGKGPVTGSKSSGRMGDMEGQGTGYPWRGMGNSRWDATMPPPHGYSPIWINVNLYSGIYKGENGLGESSGLVLKTGRIGMQLRNYHQHQLQVLLFPAILQWKCIFGMKVDISLIHYSYLTVNTVAHCWNSCNSQTQLLHRTGNRSAR